MVERRKEPRFDPLFELVGSFFLKDEITGSFKNEEKFIVKNISLRGINIISNFLPKKGTHYSIFLEYEGQKQEFEIKVIHSNIAYMEPQKRSIIKPGMVYSSGCFFQNVKNIHTNLLLVIIKEQCIDVVESENPPAGSTDNVH
jgi:hypothetical protein